MRRYLLVFFVTAVLGLAQNTFVGSAVCEGCHEDTGKALAKTPHHGIAGPNDCESCHGPGSKHAGSAEPADIVLPTRLSPAMSDRICLTCHFNTPTHADRMQSGHAKANIPCTSCHKIHTDPLVTRKPAQINAQCEGCHANVLAQFARPFKHRVLEGAMSCTDCHNPHGALRTCDTCHGDKRGPFTFEHAPVRLEGCGSCHESHGSANPRMLTRHEVRFVCLECHSNFPTSVNARPAVSGVVPPAFHDLRSARFRNCTVCHQKIHGSYTDRSLLR